jgi:exonuclease III
VAIYHQNIQGLRCKTDELLNFLEPNLPHVLCISEHRLNQFELGLLQLDNYTLGASYCRNSLKKGGVCIYVHQDLNFNTVDLNIFSNDQHIEACAVSLSNSVCNTYILLVYRAPVGNFTHFLNKLESLLNLLYTNNSKLVLCGDINVNYLIYNNNKKQLETLLSYYNLSIIVNFPARVQNSSVTAIDNIFIDVSIHDNYSVFSLCNGLSDHEAQLIVLSDVKVNAKAVSFKNRTRRIDQTAVQDFQYQLSYEVWDTVFSANDINIMLVLFSILFLDYFIQAFL